MPPRTTSFRLFPYLPTELRLKIWTYTLRPRLLELSLQHLDQYMYESTKTWTLYDAFSVDPWHSNFKASSGPLTYLPKTPMILQTCHESRQFALFAGYIPFITEHWKFGKLTIMWNPTLDTLIYSPNVESSARLHFDPPSLLSKIRRFAVSPSHGILDGEGQATSIRSLYTRLRSRAPLQEFSVVLTAGAYVDYQQRLQLSNGDLEKAVQDAIKDVENVVEQKYFVEIPKICVTWRTKSEDFTW